ncbi:cytochrome P450 monooxygenase [Aspergillus californicus]
MVKFSANIKLEKRRGGSYLLVTSWPLYRNWRRSRALDLPIIVSPVSRGSLLQQALHSASVRQVLPTCIAGLPFIRLSRGSWTFREKFEIHDQCGRIFILVTPTSCELYVADAFAAKQVLDRRADFLKPNKLLSRMEAFGQNLATVDGDQWQRHHRLTRKAFHDKTYRTVWNEAYKQASLLFDRWNNTDIANTQSDMVTLSLNILFKACFNLDDQGSVTEADILSLQKHLEVYLRSLTGYPAQAFQAGESSRLVLSDFFTRLLETRKSSTETESRNDLLSSMLSVTGQKTLSQSEIAGNLFFFIFAGHETTASALVYITHLLAIFPHWQDWASEEIDLVFSNHTTTDYQSLYPRLKRLHALLYETLRLYGPVPTIVRIANNHSQTINTNNDKFIIPANMPVNINAIAVHTDPDVWGDDCLDWNPGRWISPTGEELSPKFSKHFLSWGSGPRICPGQRFSQIEVLAVLVCLLRSHRVSLVPDEGRTMQEARAQALHAIKSSSVGLTLRMPSVKVIRLIER